MKRPFLLGSMFIISLFVCTGCFDLEEYLFLKKDGSGSFSFVINMSKMMSMSQFFSDSTQTQQSPEEEQINSSFERSRLKIAKLPGITNYAQIADTVNYRFGFSFEFKDIQSLNKALNYVFAQDTTKDTDYVYFELKNNQLSRLEPTDMRDLVNAPKSGKSAPKDKNNLFNFDMLFSDVNFNSSYEFEQAIDSVANENSLLSPKGNKVLLTCHPFATDSISQACTLKNKIFLK